MNKITINNNEFQCPMIGTIKERGEINYGVCRICKFNVLRQIVDNNIYCNYGGSINGGDDEQSQITPEQAWEQYNNNNN